MCRIGRSFRKLQASKWKKRLTYNGAVTRAPAIEAWFAERSDPLGEIALTWFTHIRDCGADVVELLHDGYATACIENVPFAYVAAFTKHVNVGFFMGASLPDPQGLMEGTGKRMRHVKLRPGVAIDGDALLELIQASYRDARDYVAARRQAT